MSLLYLNRNEIKAVLEHLSLDTQVKIFKAIAGAAEEYEDYLITHKMLVGYLSSLNSDSQISLELSQEDEIFDDIVRATLHYIDFKATNPATGDARAAWVSLGETLFPAGGRTVLLSHPEEIAVAQSNVVLLKNNQEIATLVQGSELPQLVTALASSADKLQAILNKVQPKQTEELSYKETRFEWVSALNELRRRVEIVLGRQVKRNKLTETARQQQLHQLFDSVDQTIQKALERSKRKTAKLVEDMAADTNVAPSNPTNTPE